MDTTLKALADKLGKDIVTPRRWIKRGQKDPQFCETFGITNAQKFAQSDDLPEKLFVYLLEKNGYPERPYELSEDNSSGFLAERLKAFRTIDEKDDSERKLIDLGEALNQEYTIHAEPVDKLEVKSETDRIVKDGTDALCRILDKEADKATRNVTTLSDRIFHQDTVSVIMLSIPVAADGFSCGWISYDAFKVWPAVAFFSLIGVAVAFASIRNAVMITETSMTNGYKSKIVITRQSRLTADRWLWGFIIIQLLLHASAFHLFDASSYADASLAVGKWIVCIAIPVATAGISITLRKKTSHE